MREAFAKAQISKPRDFDCRTVPFKPHMTPNRLLAFMPNMMMADSYLEYGAGGSTTMAHLYDVPRITSVESNGDFVEALRLRFPAPGTTIIHADLGTVGDWGDPVDTSPTPENRQRWNHYARCPWDLFEARKEEPPEFILIDGAVRTLCILESFMRLPNHCETVFFLDDAQYVDYDAAAPFMADRIMVEDVKDDERGRRVKQGLLFRKASGIDREACHAAIQSFTL